MQKHEAAAYIAGLSSGENSSESQTTNVHIITATVEQDSDEGTALVSVEGMVFGESDDQYFEVDTIGGLLEGDTTSLILTGEPGHGMTPLSLGGVGTVDRVVKRVSEIEADYVQAGYLEANYAHIHDGIIDNAQINDANIVDGSITGAKIRDGEITGSKIAGATITGSNIANGTITSTQISDSGITGSKIDASTFANGQISGSKIDSSTLTNVPFASIANADVEVANIANTEIGKATITQAQVENLSADYAHLTQGVIDNAKIDHSDVNGLNANYAHIQNGVIDNAKIGHADVNGLNANYAHIQNGVIDNAKIGHADVNGLNANYAHIQNGIIDNAKIDHANVNGLSANYATVANLNAANAKISNLEATRVTTEDLEANYIDANTIEATYTKTDFSNTDVAWIQNGVIKDGSISSAMINDVSANKLTAGTINGSLINVTNLNADNITTGTINGQRIGEGSLSLSKLEDDVYTEAEVDAKLSTMQSQIDGAIETWTGTAVPTLQNAPASSWNTTALKDSHVGDVYFVVNSQSQQNGYNYRFTKSGSTYSWQLIKDSDVTNALQRLTTAEGKITTFDTDISQLKTDTGTLTTKTTSLETRMSDAEADILDKVDTTTFNEVSDTVDQHSQTISQHTTAISNKADSSTVTAVTNRVSKNEQDISGINTTIGTLQTTVESKADGSTVSTISNKLNTVSDTVDGHTQSISSITSTQTTMQGKLDKTLVETTQLWFSKANTTAPNKPTAQVTSTSTDGNAWRVVVPAYNASYPNYYYCYQWKYSDGTYGWSSVTRDIAMGESQERARTAITNAAAADTKAGNAASAAATAVSTANTANDNASTALSTANTAASDASDAKSDAATAVSTANTASSNASTALSTANTASSNALTAVSTANTAKSTADTAKATADKNVKSTTQLWYTKANETAPSKPTGKVTSTAVSGNGWRVVVPTYASDYPYYFYCYQYELADGTFTWSDVVYDRATTENQSNSRNAVTGVSTLTTKTNNIQDTVDGHTQSLQSITQTQTTIQQNAVKSTVQLWFTKANTTAPNKPTAHVTTNNAATGNAWNLAVPTYNSAYPNYYYCYEYQYVDGSYGWSAVTRDIATGEMQATARQAQADIDGLEIGGRNLLRNTNWTPETITAFKASTYSTTQLGNAIGEWYRETQVTLGFDASGLMTITVPNNTTRYGIYQDVSLSPGHYILSVDTGSFFKSLIDSAQWPAKNPIDGINSRNSVEIDVAEEAVYRVYIAYNNGSVMYGNHMKLEKGNKATDWTPAPEDVDADISTAQTSADNAQATANKSVKESQQLWFTKANGSAPNKPSAKVTSTSTGGNAWTTKVPTYNENYKYYFYCMQYIAADGTVTWSDVVYDQATTEAQNVARTASADLTEFHQEYATFKQTVNEFESTVGETYTTKTELGEAFDNRVDDSVEFLYRAVSDTEGVSSGRATIKRIKGNTLRWNQLAQSIESASWRAAQNTTASRDGGKITATVTTAGYGYRVGIFNSANTVKGVKGHKYLVSYYVLCDKAANFGCDALNSGSTLLSACTAGVRSHIAGIFNYPTYEALVPNGNIYLCSMTSMSVGDTFTIDSPQLFDLTQMFGAGNEPSTVAEFEALFPEPYYPYDAGSLLPVRMEGVETVGFNQWDEQWEVGNLTADGVPTTATNTIRSKNFCKCLSSTLYYLRTPKTDGGSQNRYYLCIVFYDADKQFIIRVWGNNQTVTSPDNAAYFKIATNTATVVYGPAYLDDICINISDTTRNGTYEPYWSSQRPIPASTYFPDGMRSAGTVRDELTATQAITRVGAVDLGTLYWSYSEGSDYFIADLPESEPTPKLTDASQLPNGKCPNYEPAPFYLMYQQADPSLDGCFAITNGGAAPRRLYFRNRAYTDAAAFKAAVSGVILHYELATPTTTPIDPPLNLSYKVDANGTERVMVDETEDAPQSAPLPIGVTYGINLYESAGDDAASMASIESRVSTAETSITNNSTEIALRAKATDVYTKTQVDGKITQEANDRNSAIEQSASAINLSVSQTYTTKNESKSAIDYAAAMKSNFGYEYHADVMVYGDEDKYYPVYITKGDQYVMREIRIYRGYSEKAPNSWNTSSTAHHGSLNLVCRMNFGGWGGTEYKTIIIDFGEMYSHPLGDVRDGSNAGLSGMGGCFYLRGGGTGGAIYHFYSDQPLDNNFSYPIEDGTYKKSPYVGVTQGELLMQSGTYKFYVPAPLTAPATSHIESLYTDGLAKRTNAIYGICSTAAGTSAKVVSLADFALYIGATISVRFNSGNTVASPTLNVNNTGAKAVVVNGSATPTADQCKWNAYATCQFTYDGTYWRYVGSDQEAVRIVSAETAIEQNSEQITLRATKTEMKQAIDDIEVGGRNLLFLTKNFATKSGKTNGGYLSAASIDTKEPIVSETYKGFAVRHFMTSSIDTDTYYDLVYNNILVPVSGKSYVFSFYAKGTGKIRTHFYPNTSGGTYKNIGSQGQNNTATDGQTDFIVTSDWQRFWVRFEIGGTQGTSARFVCLRVFGGNDIYVCGLKFEEGTKVTDWSPAPEDIESRVEAAEASIAINADNIESKVSKDGVISSINQSAESVQIHANRVNIEGATIFSSGRLSTTSLNSTYDAKGAASTAESNAKTYAKSQANAVQANLDNLEIGGRNLLFGTADKFPKTATLSPTHFAEFTVSNGRLKNAVTLEEGVEYTFSVDVTTTVSNFMISIGCGNGGFSKDVASKANLSNGRCSITFTPTDTQLQSGTTFAFRAPRYGSPTDFTYTVDHPKLEKGNKATDWTPAPEDVDASIDANSTGLGIKWNYSNFTDGNSGEAYLCARDVSTGVFTDAAGWVWFNGAKRTVPKGMVNPDAVALNKTIYVVCRLSSATATTGTNYIVWYNSGWKYLTTGIDNTASGASTGTWTWAVATDMVLASFVMLSADSSALVDCQQFTPPLTSQQVTSGDTSYAKANAVQANLDNLEIGGRNLFVDTDRYCELVSESNAFGGENLPDTIIPEGRVITISVEIDADDVVWSTASGQHRIGVEFSISKTGGGSQYIGAWAGKAVSEGANIVEAFTGSLHKRVSKTFTLLGNVTVGRDALLYAQGVSSGSIRVGRVKVEYGTKATDWTPAPEDTDAAISAVSTVANAAAPKTSAVSEEQYIYFQAESGEDVSSTVPSSVWVTKTDECVTVADDEGTSTNTRAWSTKTPTYNSTYPVTWMAKQRKTVSGTVTTTTPTRHAVTTVIDGAQITTGTIDAERLNVSDIASSNVMVTAINSAVSEGTENLISSEDAGTMIQNSIEASESRTNTAISNLNDDVSDLSNNVSSLMDWTEIGPASLKMGKATSYVTMELTNESLEFLASGEALMRLGVTKDENENVTGSYMVIDKAVILQQLQFGNYAFRDRGSDHMSLQWIGD